MTANGSKPYLDYLNKLVEMNIAILVITGKKPINANYFTLTEETESNHKAPKFKASDRVRITKYKNIFSKGYTKNWSQEEFVIDSMLKTNPWSRTIKYLNEETIIGSFNEK